MFEALNKASVPHKYKVEWVELETPRFKVAANAWLNTLSAVIGGPWRSDRRTLANEFLQVLYIYKQMLMKHSAYGAQSRLVVMANSKIASYGLLYRTQFGEDLTHPAQELPSELEELTKKLAINAHKRDVIVAKKKVIKYWLTGVQHFNDHIDDVSLTLQYLGNAESAKVRMFLAVMCKDADKLAALEDPRAIFKTKSEVQTGRMTAGENGALTKVTWTDDDFKRAVKAEFGAAYGVKASGECTIEITGLKAEFKAEAFAGAAISAEGEASWGRGRGVQVTGKVEAMVGIKIKMEANIDVADIFLIEASAEAFAGAMAKAECEFKATVDGVTFKLEAEAFAGAMIKGKAAMTMRMCGYDIIKGEVEGSLTAGIGANFKLEVESSAFEGTKVAIEAGVTVGIGGGAGSKFTVYSDNLPRVANAIYYTGYLTLMGETMKKYAWQNYFRNLEDNEVLFKKADEIIDQHLIKVFQDHQTLFASQMAWKQLEVLSIFKTTGRIPEIDAPMRRPRRGAIIGRR